MIRSSRLAAILTLAFSFVSGVLVSGAANADVILSLIHI